MCSVFHAPATFLAAPETPKRPSAEAAGEHACSSACRIEHEMVIELRTMKRVGMRERREIHSRRPPGGRRARIREQGHGEHHSPDDSDFTLRDRVHCTMRACVCPNILHVIDMLRATLVRDCDWGNMKVEPDAGGTTETTPDGKATPRRSNFIPFPLSFRFSAPGLRQSASKCN